MKRRKSHIVLVAVLLLASSMMASASRKKEITLVMVPRDEATVKVGLDLAERYPTLLISYLIRPNGAISLNGWTGTDWVNVNLKDFQGGDFFKNGPSAALIITAAGSSLSSALIPPSEWAESVYQIRTTATRPMLHLIGQFYNFKYKEWQWFAKRNALTVEAINPEGLNVAWYNRRLSENLTRSAKPEESDLQYWSILRYPQAPAPVEPVEPKAVVVKNKPVAEELPAEEVPAETITEESAPAVEETPADAAPEALEVPAEDAADVPAMPEPEDPEVNPFTVEVPAAMVLGAGDAEEANKAGN